MRVVDTITELRAVRLAMAETVGLVPTMGALHDGHISLVKTAREDNSHVIATIFVNPTQFGPNEDYATYPRDLDNDLHWLESEGVDVVFTPTPDIMYPTGYQTYIDVGELGKKLEGSSRPEHFRGVTTIVAKIFNLVQPHHAYFGQKDAQQVVIIRRMVNDLNFPVKIIPCPIVREADGLAMSSRNRYLSPEQRIAAIVLSKALKHAGTLYTSGIKHPEQLRQAIFNIFSDEPLAEIDYISVANAHTLEELDEPSETPILVSLTARFNETRLLDNMLLPLELNTREGLQAHLGNPL